MNTSHEEERYWGKRHINDNNGRSRIAGDTVKGSQQHTMREQRNRYNNKKKSSSGTDKNIYIVGGDGGGVGGVDDTETVSSDSLTQDTTGSSSFFLPSFTSDTLTSWSSSRSAATTERRQRLPNLFQNVSNNLRRTFDEELQFSTNKDPSSSDTSSVISGNGRAVRRDSLGSSASVGTDSFVTCPGRFQQPFSLFSNKTADSSSCNPKQSFLSRNIFGKSEIVIPEEESEPNNGVIEDFTRARSNLKPQQDSYLTSQRSAPTRSAQELSHVPQPRRRSNEKHSNSFIEDFYQGKYDTTTLSQTSDSQISIEDFNNEFLSQEQKSPEMERHRMSNFLEDFNKRNKEAVHQYNENIKSIQRNYSVNSAPAMSMEYQTQSDRTNLQSQRRPHRSAKDILEQYINNKNEMSPLSTKHKETYSPREDKEHPYSIYHSNLSLSSTPKNQVLEEFQPKSYFNQISTPYSNIYSENYPVSKYTDKPQMNRVHDTALHERLQKESEFLEDFQQHTDKSTINTIQTPKRSEYLESFVQKSIDCNASGFLETINRSSIDIMRNGFLETFRNTSNRDVWNRDSTASVVTVDTSTTKERNGFLGGLKSKLMNALEDELSAKPFSPEDEAEKSHKTNASENSLPKIYSRSRTEMAKKVVMMKLEIDSLKLRSGILFEFEKNHPDQSLDQLEIMNQEIEHRQQVLETYSKQLRFEHSDNELIDEEEVSKFHNESLMKFQEQDEEFRELYRKRAQEDNVGCVSRGNHVSFIKSEYDDYSDDESDAMPRTSFASSAMVRSTFGFSPKA